MLHIGDHVRITGSKSVKHFGKAMPGIIEAIEEWNGQAPVYGKPEYTEHGQLKKAYMIRFQDGTNYIGAYRREELTKVQ